MRLRHHGHAIAIAWCTLAVAPARAHAQGAECSARAPEVTRVSFSGNDAIRTSALESTIETTRSSLLRRVTRVVGTRRCLTQGALLRDVTRLMLFYRRKGFPRVAVDTTVERAGKERVEVGFVIHENAPIIVDSVELRGISDSALVSRLRKSLQLRAGEPLDRFALDASTTGVVTSLRRVGYLSVTARAGTRVDSAALRAVAWIEATTGRRVRVGTVRVDTRASDSGEARMPASRVRRLTRLRPGMVLGSGEVADARRSLENTEIFDEIRITLDSIRSTPPADGTDGGPDPAPQDATADLAVSVVEGPPNEVNARAGYGTLDCFRVRLQGKRVGVLGHPGSFELTTTLSKVAVGRPLDFASGLCSSTVRSDPFSSRLNYYVGGNYTIASSYRRGLTRSFSLYTERRSEFLAYLKTTYVGGAATIARSMGPRWTASLGYDISYARTEAEPAVLCATFSACLESDRRQFTEALPFGLVSGVVSFNNTDNPLDPSRGATLRAELRVAPAMLGTAPRQQVVGARFNAAAYVKLSNRVVLAGRVQTGAINTFGRGAFIPQGERLFAGGASTVRGFRQNEVGPRVYLADSVRPVVRGADTLLWSLPPDSTKWRAVPTGGTTEAVANLEVRVRPRVLEEFVQFVAFVDAGNVWTSGQQELSGTPIFVTPGVGVRISTPIGPIRFDVASNSYAPAKGPAYRDVSLGYQTAPLYCVSIGNRLPVTGTGQTDAQGRLLPPVQAEGPCPSTFAPQRPRSFLDRLTINFSMGQAF